MDAQLLEILACPDEHHAPLTYDATAQTLTCTQCGRVFPIRDGIPVLLLDEATMPAASARQTPEPAAAPAVPQASATEATTTAEAHDEGPTDDASAAEDDA
jgi:uncharacterized protein YbaR (Trm112 family)